MLPSIGVWFGIEAINLAIESFNLENGFDGKDIHAEVALIYKNVLNIFSNFKPNRRKIFTDNDPTWVSEDIKDKIEIKNKFYRQCIRHWAQISSLLKLENLHNKISNLVTKSK